MQVATSFWISGTEFQVEIHNSRAAKGGEWGMNYLKEDEKLRMNIKSFKSLCLWQTTWISI